MADKRQPVGQWVAVTPYMIRKRFETRYNGHSCPLWEAFTRAGFNSLQRGLDVVVVGLHDVTINRVVFPMSQQVEAFYQKRLLGWDAETSTKVERHPMPRQGFELFVNFRTYRISRVRPLQKGK